jgi:nucleotide-binding universal stress UspA family protein
MLPIHTILYPTDLSELATPAFQFACALARDQEARVVVLYVVPPPICHGEVVARRQPDGFYEGLWQELRDIRASGASPNVEYRLAEGDAVTEIVHTAEEIKADLIVMGTHGRTGLRHLLMGSVAERILRQAPCPVVTVKCPFTDLPLEPTAELVAASTKPARVATKVESCR